MGWTAYHVRSYCYSTVILSNTHAWSRSTQSEMSQQQQQHLLLITVFTNPPARLPALAWSDSGLLFVQLSIKKLRLAEEYPSLRWHVRTSQWCTVSSDWIASWLLSKMLFNAVRFVFRFARYPQQFIDIQISPYRKMYCEWIISISTSWKIRSHRESIHGEWLQLY